MGGDSYTCWKAVGNELRRLDNGIEKWVRSIVTIEFTRKEEVPKLCTVTYSNFVCD